MDLALTMFGSTQTRKLIKLWNEPEKRIMTRLYGLGKMPAGFMVSLSNHASRHFAFYTLRQAQGEEEHALGVDEKKVRG